MGVLLTQNLGRMLKIWRFGTSLSALHILISWCEQNPFIPLLLLLSSLCCPLPVPRALLCVINYDCTGWQHTATVLINYRQWEELFLSSSLPLPSHSLVSFHFFFLSHYLSIPFV